MDRISEFDSLSPEIRSLIFEKACDWFYLHENEITIAMNNEFVDYPPSGTDIYMPEVWKGVHWKWFMRLIGC